MAESDFIEAAFRRASAALDELWQLYRERKLFAAPLVDTLSNNLADPNYLDVYVMIHRMLPVTSARERAALQCIARACFGDALITEVSYARLLKEIGT
jgi:hypothetical protein